MTRARPNIILVFTDQLRGDAVGVPGAPVIAPNIDRLAREGVVFTRCVSNSPLCVPARASLMTGRLPREHGAWSNAVGADEKGPSHVRNIRDAGYQTAVFGKTHLWRVGPGGRAGMHAREMDHNLAAWGFDERLEVNDPIGTRFMGCAYTDYLESRGWLAAHQEYMHAWVSEMRDGDIKPWDQQPAPVPQAEDIDSFIGRRAVEWLRDAVRGRAGRPFYLQVQFTGPHDPYDAPTAWRDCYRPAELDPGIAALPEPPTPRSIQARLERAPSLATASTEQRQRWRANYYANVSLIDHWIGQLLAVLAESDALARTWIVFSSDHGELLGDHGLWGKAAFYEGAVHVPCIMRAPARDGAPHGGGGRVVGGLTEHIDIPVTLVDVAGAEPLPSGLGRSLRATVESGTDGDPGKEVVLSELFGQVMLRTHRYKLVVRLEDHERYQFFDLSDDPQETRNLVADPAQQPTIDGLIGDYLLPLERRTDLDRLARYRAYVRRTGSIN